MLHDGVQYQGFSVKIFSAVALLPAALLVVACQGSGSKDIGKGYSKFERSCITALKKRLKSPSSFKLVNTTNFTTAMTFSEQETQEIRERLIELSERERSGENLPAEEDLELLKLSLKSNAALHGGGVSFGVLIKYDADNSYGASLRDEKICSYDSFTGEFGEYDDEDDVLIDGQKYLDWLLHN